MEEGKKEMRENAEIEEDPCDVGNVTRKTLFRKKNIRKEKKKAIEDEEKKI